MNLLHTLRLFAHYLTSLLLSLLYLLTGRILTPLSPTLTPLLRRQSAIPRHSQTQKTIVITGATSGIGLALATTLASTPATIYLLVRSPSKGYAVAGEILARVPTAKVYVQSCDVSKLSSVRRFVRDWEGKGTIDILYLNAGMTGPSATSDRFSVDGLEITYATNFLGHFLLTGLLEKGGHLAPDARVVLTSSLAQYVGRIAARWFCLRSVKGRVEWGFHTGLLPTSSGLYSNSKLMQCVFVRALQERWARGEVERKSLVNGETAKSEKGTVMKSGRVAHAFHPGVVATSILKGDNYASIWRDPPGWLITKIGRFMGISAEEAASTGVYLGLSSDKEVERRGGYWDRMKRRTGPASLMDERTIDALWVRWCRDAGIEWEYY